VSQTAFLFLLISFLSIPYRERATSFCAEKRRPKALNEKIQSAHHVPSHHLHHAAAVKHVFSQTIKRKMLCKTCAVSCIIATPIENAKCITQGKKKKKTAKSIAKTLFKVGYQIESV
jgi:hypothetical protein